MAAYMILQGVRRAVAYFRAGKVNIPAILHDPNHADVLTRMRLDELYSTKPSVLRDHRYIRNTEYPTVVLGTEPLPITVMPISSAVARQLTPIAQVRLV
jgi:hypothetical protein